MSIEEFIRKHNEERDKKDSRNRIIFSAVLSIVLFGALFAGFTVGKNSTMPTGFAVAQSDDGPGILEEVRHHPQRTQIWLFLSLMWAVICGIAVTEYEMRKA